MKFNHNKLQEIAKPLPEKERREMAYQIKYQDKLLDRVDAELAARRTCLPAKSSLRIHSEIRVACGSIESRSNINMSVPIPNSSRLSDRP